MALLGALPVAQFSHLLNRAQKSAIKLGGGGVSVSTQGAQESGWHPPHRRSRLFICPLLGAQVVP